MYLQSENVRNEIYKTGRVGFWYGHKCLELPNNFKSGTALAEKVLDDKTVYIIPNVEEKMVKLVVEPELLDINESSLARVDETIEIAARWTAGANVIVGSAIGAFVKHP